MNTQREPAGQMEAPNKGSTTDPSGGDTHQYDPTTVEVGMTGFTAGLPGSSWDEAGPAYRQEFEQQHAPSGRRWEDAEPGYRYAHEMRVKHEGRSFEEAEPDLSGGYGEWSRERGYQHEHTTWDRSRDDVRSQWQRGSSS